MNIFTTKKMSILTTEKWRFSQPKNEHFSQPKKITILETEKWRFSQPRNECFHNRKHDIFHNRKKIILKQMARHTKWSSFAELNFTILVLIITFFFNFLGKLKKLLIITKKLDFTEFNFVDWAKIHEIKFHENFFP